MQAFLGSHGGEFVFESQFRKKPSANGIRGLLKAICQRAGVRSLNPHLFRSFVVNYGMRQGATLENMARYLGHEASSTTSRHYWTDEINTTVNIILEAEVEEEEEKKLAKAKQELGSLQQELTRLRLLLDEAPKQEEAAETKHHLLPLDLGLDLDVLIAEVLL